MVVARSYGADDIKLLRKSVVGSIIIGCCITIIIMTVSQLAFLRFLIFFELPEPKAVDSFVIDLERDNVINYEIQASQNVSKWGKLNKKFEK